MANTIEKSNQLAKEMCNGNYRYLYGAKGESYTTTLVNKFASMYPSVFTPSLKSLALKDADKGYKAIDCSGFVCKVLGISAMGSAQMKNTAVKTYSVNKSNAKPGMALWKSGHIAYVGDGLKIYEAKSTASDMSVSTWENRADAFTNLIVVKGSALAGSATTSSNNISTSTSANNTYTKYDSAKAAIIATSASTLNIRADASASSAKVGSYAKGASVSLIGEKGDFYRTDKGFISKKYVSINQTVQSEYPWWGICTGNSVRLRSTTSTANTKNVIKKINTGEGMTVIKKSGSWLYVNHAGTEGWISGKYVRRG